jgi:DNA-binding transcriptional LysR family regulator
MINMFDIKCFLSLSNTLNFTKTAQDMFLSQQAVSQRIARIEESIGFPLFVRSRSFVKLTRTGEQCYRFLAPFYEEFNALLVTCRQEFDNMSKCLKVGYQNMLNWSVFLNTAQNALRKETPGLELIGELFDSNILVKHLEQGRVNMIVIYERFAPKMDGLEKADLMKMPLLLMVSATHPKATEHATYKTFAQDPFIEDVFGKESPDQTIKRAKKTASYCNLTPSDYIIVPNRDSANMAAESGRGIIIGTKLSYSAASQNLCKYPTDAQETLICLWKEEEENILVRRYVKCLQQVCKSEFFGF